MKKSIIPILAVLMLPVSCAKVELPAEPDEEQHNENIEGTVIISARTDPDTKAVLRDGTKVAFQSTDTVSVFSGTAEGFYNDPFTVKDTYSDGSADFQGTLSEATEDAMVVMYPYQKGAKLEKYGPTASNQRKLYFTIPTVQTATTGSFDHTAFICTGVTESSDEGSLSVTLGTVCALVKFTMPEGSYTKVALTANNGEALAGAYSVSKSDGYKELIEGDTQSTVTLNGQIAGGQTYYMAVAPATASSGITVQIFDEEGFLAGEKSTTKAVTFTRNRILNLGTLTGQDENKWLGKGTQDSPYIISCANHLQMLSEAYSTKESAEEYAGKYFLQTKDIDMDGEPLTIGNFMEDVNPSDFHYGAAFNATYDGGGHMIKGYKLKLVDEKPDFSTRRHAAGLFNIVKNGTIKNLTVLPEAGTNNVTMSTDDINDVLDSYYIGLLAGVVAGNSTISNCHTGKWTYKFYCKELSTSESLGFEDMDIMIGGLVGATNGVYGDYDARFPTISNCTNEATIIVNDGMKQISVGGILGSNLPSNEICYIDRCRNKGKISVTSADAQVFAGGIAGRITNNNELETGTYRFSNCVNEADIEAITTAAEYACAGGIIGSHNSDGDWGEDPWFHNCLNKGDIYASGGDDLVFDTTSANAGGICGYCDDEDTKFALCINTGRIFAEVDPYIAPITVTDGDQYWCFWLYTDEFDGYKPDGDYYKLFSCYGFITGDGQGTDNPEYVRTHGKTGDDSSSKTLYTETEWSEAQWKAAAAWTGTSDSNWGTTGHRNDLDLIF